MSKNAKARIWQGLYPSWEALQVNYRQMMWFEINSSQLFFRLHPHRLASMLLLRPRTYKHTNVHSSFLVLNHANSLLRRRFAISPLSKAVVLPHFRITVLDYVAYQWFLLLSNLTVVFRVMLFPRCATWSEAAKYVSFCCF